MRLPPYGKSIDHSKELIILWAGENTRVHQSVRVFGKNTLAFYPPNDPKEFVWFVKDRLVVVVHFFEPENIWIMEIARALLKSGASEVAEVSWPHKGAWWNPHYDLYVEFFKRIDQPITINHYLRS